jgi:hypothetical protein
MMDNPTCALTISTARGATMAQGIDSTKTPARPSHEAIESEHHDLGEHDSKTQKLDKVGMESAKRAENRIHGNEEVTRKESIFSK